MTKHSFRGGVFNSLATRRVVYSSTFLVLALGLISTTGIFASDSASATSTSGAVQLNTEVATSIAMKIASPNDTNPDCMEQSGVTYGVANRYATSNGAEGSKQVDTFDGTTGGADEVNSNTSCATLTMSPNTFSSTYSDITVYTNSPSGYALSVRSADNTSPNLVNTTDPTQYIPAAALTEVDGTIDDGQGGTTTAKVVPGGQNKWALKSDTGLLDTWTPVATTDTTVRAYDQETHNGSTTRVTYGISSGNNPTGKYATTLTYTATMFDGPNSSIPSADTSSSNNVTFSPADFKVPYNETRSLTITPNTGHYISSITCTDGYTCTDENGDPIIIDTSTQSPNPITIRVTSTNKTESGTITVSTTPISYSVSITGDENNEANSLTLSTENLTIPYGESRTVTVTPNTGYYLDSVDCANGYICEKDTTTGSLNNANNANSTNGTNNANSDPFAGILYQNVSAAGNNAIDTGEEAIYAQDIKITNNDTTSGGSISFKTAPRHFAINLSGIGTGTGLSADKDSLSIAYGHSETLTITPEENYYLSSVSCPEGYTCTKTDGTAIDTGLSATAAQTIRVSNRRTTTGGTLSFTAYGSYDVAITPSLNATTSTNLLTIPYGGSKTFTITPNEGYYLTSLTCSSGYTCSGYTTGSASDPNATSRGTQTITVTNNSTTNTGAISFTLDNKYRISYSKTNIANPSASYTDVAYGGQTTVTVTPASGYYLSAFSGCPSGWTCSGVSTGKNYTSAQTLTLKNNSSVNTGTITLTGTISAEYMQDFSCSSLASGASKTLRDSRDNNDYTVKKLADGKCWMTQNLRLVGSRTLTSADSNVSSNFTLTASSSGTWCQDKNSTCINKSMVLNSGNTTYGTYYNWYAATAGTGTYSKTSGNATSSICPKGWRLPTSTEFNTLYNNYKGSSKMQGTPAFVLSGYRYGSSTNGQGSGAIYWSSTAYDSYNAYRLYLSSSDVGPQSYDYKYSGLTVRCVASS